MRVNVEVVPDVGAVATAAADRIEAAAREGGHVALAGGSSPKQAYALLAGRGADLRRATFWFSDDRSVGPEDPNSNYRMAAESLLDHLPEPHRPRVHRIEGELGHDDAAARYEALIRAELGDAPVFDLVLLGLGPDTHTASLFPGKPALEERTALVVGVPEAGMEPYVPRVTFTLPLLAAAREVVFLVSGADKAPAVARAFAEPPDPGAPAGRVRPATVILDEAAAAELPG